ncbi:DNRLRE domain-containing protein [Algibacter miyuki]|uniref:DNRLRE domain-containing protein n=1 Tax=Algibacter miyuki TaxID=1306933 RepID=A0ABV5GYY3_9FLAO|nr:DNRLRE domain-containing protein [Algibacter miyuki]MDN3666958.1 DNRLRE domain-containing protein [Algibacter miyuki]
MKNILLFALLWSTCISWAQTNYYVDNVGGDDTNLGTSEATAFQSLTKINTLTFSAGDAILFKKGGEWTGTLRPLGSGAVGSRIVIGSYGSGDLPIIDGGGIQAYSDYMSAAIILFNQEYWEIRDIEVRNLEPGNPTNPIEKAGILVLGKDYGTLHDFKLENLKINKVNGSLETRENGGIFFDISTGKVADRLPTNFDGIHVNNCYFLDVDRGGFLNQSYWSRRDLTSNFGEENLDGTTNRWYPSYNIVVENSKFENIGGNGLVIRVAEAPLVKHNLFVKNGLKTTGNASYPYNCDNALWQYNEACYTVYNDGDADASGFDSDYMCKNTTIEYNYSHHNDWGGLLVCSNSGLTNAFNDGTVVQKNVFQDESNHMIRFSGNITNSTIFNNLFITDAKIDQEMMWYKHWGGTWPEKTEINDNIFYNEGTPDFLTIGSTIDNSFLGNVLFGNEFSDFTDFVPSKSEDEADLESKIDQVRAIGNRSELLVSQAENVINIIWDEGVNSTIVDIPTQVNVSVKEDSYVRGGTYADDNLNGPLMEIKQSGSNNENYIRDVFLKFDIKDYNAISSAILHVSGNLSGSSDFNVNVRKVVDDSWEEGTLTWNKAPVASALIGSFSTPGDTEAVFQDVHINVTDYIQEQLEANDDLVSFNLSAATSSSNAFKIKAKEGTGIVAYLSIIEGATLSVQNEAVIESKFTVYPNPTQNSFVIQTSNSEISNVNIFSINGSVLYSNNNVNSNRFTVDISAFETGVYFVQVKNTHGDLSVEKVIKK